MFSRILRILAISLLSGLMLPPFASAQEPAKIPASDQKPAEKTISLTFDYGDGVQKQFNAITWHEGDTIAEALATAKKHRRGISFEQRGQGATALLLKIDDCANGTDDRYWTYQVNGKKGDRSFAVRKLEPGDAVLWKFATYP